MFTTTEVLKSKTFNIYQLSVSDHLDRLSEYMIPLEQRQALRTYRLKHDRDKRILSRAFLYHYVDQYYHVKKFTLQYNDYQRPFLKYFPDLSFSFSYAGDYVLVGVSDSKKIGVDIEQINKHLNVNELASAIMHPEELAYYTSLLTWEKRLHFFFDIFNAKEALIKTIGKGLYEDVRYLNLVTLKKNVYTHKGLNYYMFDFNGLKGFKRRGCQLI